MPYYTLPRHTPPQRREPFLPPGAVLLIFVLLVTVVVFSFVQRGDPPPVDRTCYNVHTTDQYTPVHTFCVEEIAP